MKGNDLKEMAVGELVDRFVALALAQDQALLGGRYAEFNRLFDQMESVEQALRAREGDQRRQLLPLYHHPNAQVRLKAVKATLAVAPDDARRMLQTIADSREYPQAGEAGMSLINLARGIFKPS